MEELRLDSLSIPYILNCHRGKIQVLIRVFMEEIDYGLTRRRVKAESWKSRSEFATTSMAGIG